MDLKTTINSNPAKDANDGLSLGGDVKDNANPPVEEVNKENNSLTDTDPDIDKEYFDHRTIIISPVLNYPLYRKVNMKVLGQRRESIGSCITSCKILSSNKGEVETYFPALIGVSSNDAKFMTRVKQWLSNIDFKVTEDNTPLDVSFIYNTKRDYMAITRKEEAIEREYAKVDRANLSEIKKALKIKIDRLNALESEKYKVGHPFNLEEYLVYRHCLLYHDVAKDMALINSDASIRFYIKDEQREAQKEKQLINAKKQAMQHYIEVSASDKKYNAVYIQISLIRGNNLSIDLMKDKSQKDIDMIAFVNDEPTKYNSIVTDKALMDKAFIEMLILRGELVRSEYNQQISTSEGQFIGANMKEAVVYFTNPNNAAVRTMYENRLKLM